MKKFYFLCLVCLLFANANLYAVPASPYPIEVTQPDGTTLTIRLHGDENFHYTTTLDGFLIVKNQQNAFVYATVSQTGELQPTERIARNANARSASDVIFLQSLDTDSDISRLRNAANVPQMQRAPQQADSQTPQRYPTNGSPKSLVILVNFTDKSFVTPTPNAAFDNLCNQQGYSVNGATGSVKDWYKASSYGQFAPDFDVYGPYTLPNNMAYYGANSGSNDIRPAQMIVDACNLAASDINFALYDTDNNGRIDNVFVVYAGHNEAEGGGVNTIWPHRWVVSSTNSTGNKTFNGKTLYDYACTSELRGSSGSTIAGIGTFVHEFAHVIGMPDYYHTSSTSKNTLNYWSTMDLGSYCNNSRTPPLLSAYDRFYLGWLTPDQYIAGAKTLYPLSQSSTAATAGQAYLLSFTNHNLNGKSPTPTQFFVLEYREKTGWDTYIGNNSASGSGGMLIWHIDYSATAWNNNTVNNYSGTSQTSSSHMRVYLRPTDGSSTTTPGGAFTSGSFTPKLWNGTDINCPILNIVKNGTTNMFFGVGAPIEPTVITNAATATTATTATLNKNVTIGNEVITEQGFKYKKTSETAWETNTTGSLTNLTPNTQYQFFAYAVTATFPITTGDTLNFTTQCQTRYGSVTETICESASFIWHGTTYSTAGEYQHTTTSSIRCDSIVTLTLYVSPRYNYSENVEVCSGENYTFPDKLEVFNITEPLQHISYLTSSLNCDSIITTYLIIGQCSGINKTEFGNITIYPNPVKDELRIKNEECRINSVEIFDLTGKKMLIPHFSFLIPINVSSLPQGVYFIKIQFENSKIVFEKFIKI